MIAINALLTEKELADQFVASLTRRSLDEKFFYWFPLSVSAWLDLCSDGEYRNFVRSRSLIARTASDIAAQLPAGDIEVLSIGSGQGDKDVILLEALRSHGSNVNYVPVDSSQALLEMACTEAHGAGFQAKGIKADFARADHLSVLNAGAHNAPPRLFMMLGNTLGSVDPLVTADRLSSLLRPEDHLLFDGEIHGDQTLGGYDNPINRKFAWGPLTSIGIGPEDGNLVFEEQLDERMPGLHMITKRFEPSRSTEAIAGGKAIQFQPGERIAMNHSYKYSREAFEEVISRARLTAVWESESDDSKFVMALTRAQLRRPTT